MLPALCFFALALVSKPMAVSLPIVLLILDWYPLQRIISLRTFKTAFIEKLPFIVLSIASSILTILAQKAGGAMELNEYVPLSERGLVAVKALLTYLWKILVPLNLMPFYQYPPNVSFLSVEYFVPVVLVIGITAALTGIARKEKLWLSAWFYYTVTLIPVLGIVQVGGQSMADRYAYLPSLGPFLIAGLMVSVLYEKLGASGKGGPLFRLGTVAATSTVLLFMSYATLRQISIWKDGITLWSYVIKKEPLKVPRAYNNLGIALMDKGRIDEAVENFQIALRLDPSNANATAFNNLGVAYKTKGLYDKAIEQFQTALRIKPDDPETHNNLGVAYRYKGMYSQAIEQHRIALTLRPDFADAHFNLGIIYLDFGDKYKAREEFEAGLKIKPDDQKARQVLNDIISE
jgi:tetratricopeptide (TPR) repeat protein